MEVFPPIDFFPARALPNTSCFLAGVISLCLSPFNCVLLLWQCKVKLPNWQWGEGCNGKKNWYMHSKVSAIDFFLMQMDKKKEKCSKLRRAFLITTTVGPVGNVVGSKAQRLCVYLCITLLCCALCYGSASDSVRPEGLLNAVTNMHLCQGLSMYLHH